MSFLFPPQDVGEVVLVKQKRGRGDTGLYEWESEAATLVGVADSDGDGVPNVVDNCAVVSNVDQLDGDGDEELTSTERVVAAMDPGSNVH